MSNPFIAGAGLVLLVVTYYRLAHRRSASGMSLIMIAAIAAGLLLGFGTPAPMPFDAVYPVSVAATLIGLVAVIGYSTFAKIMHKRRIAKNELMMKASFAIRGTQK